MVIILLLVMLFIPNNFIGKLTNECTSGCIYTLPDTSTIVCLPVGIRLSDQTYCSANNDIKLEKLEDETCENNSECKTNICIEGKCKSYLTLRESYCKSREGLGYESYDGCIVGVS